jgi:GT2 family glycosyltransferase
MSATEKRDSRVSSVDLVIPTYNGIAPLRECLEAVRRQTFTDLNVIVVDDGSTDATPSMMSEEFPEFGYLSLPSNQGFAATCNAGIASGSAEFVALLNNDAVPDPDWLERLVAGIERHPSAAAVASKILLADGSGRLHAAGDTFSVRGVPGNRGVWEPDDGRYDHEEEVFSACAAAALYRRSALDEAVLAGGQVFDTDFWMYLEDIDLGWRLRLLGYSIVYVADACVCHQLSATGGGPLASYFVARNSFGVLSKNLPEGLQRSIWSRFLKHQPLLFLEAIPHIREPAARARMRGILAGPRFALSMRRKRKRILETRRAGNDEIESILSE